MTDPAVTSRPSTRAEAWARDDAPVPLIEAISIARRTVAELTGMPVDGIAASGPREDGGWRIVVEVVESHARMGENDLLAAHEVLLAPTGEPVGIARTRRYRREDGEG